MAGAETWQCVMVCWGTRYPVEVLNHLVGEIRRQAASVPRFVLITELPKPGLDPAVMLRPFPEFFLRERFRRSGCQAKLAMFEEGVVPVDLPATYVDLDTVITGDMSRGIGFMRDRQSVLMLQSAIIPFGALGRLVYRLSKGKHYARGNSSVVVWHPAEGHYIAQRFRELDARFPNHGDFRPMIADERFISWCAQPHMAALPRDYAVKFTWEFMFPWRWPILLRAKLPWVAARRARQAAITLNGEDIKPEVLIDMPEGAELTDRKGRKLIWSTAAMGPAWSRILDHCRATLGRT
ncbi:hypothetical protein [Haematobacter sp.]|uniref:hypothetical protein n=1 Tax=Haematobacter sp. TaxID=2953762 RepID=UPI0028AF021C|nr:hypothetical protein [Haematobacter sp.]